MNRTSPQTRVVIAGTARHAELYASAFQALPGAAIEAVWCPTDASEEELLAAEGLARSMQASIITDFSFAGDLVVSCVGPHRQSALVEPVLASGCALWLDQPLASSPEDLESMLLAIARYPEAKVGVASRRFSPATSEVRQVIESGALGVPFALHVTLVAHSATDARLEGSLDPAFMGGEVVRLGPIVAGTVIEILGQDVSAIEGYRSQLFYDPHRQAGVEDSAAVSISFADGASATLIMGRATLGNPGHGVLEEVRVRGTRGAINASSARTHARVGSGGELGIVEAAAAEFIASLTDARKRKRDLETAVSAQRLAWDIRDSLIGVEEVESRYKRD